MNQTSSTASQPRIVAVSAQWHAAIVQRAVDAFARELIRQGWPPDAIDRCEVPGAFEIPLLARRLALGGRHAAIAAFGLVVDGGIYRHDFVASAVIDGLMRVQLDTGVPVMSAVLTPHHFHEHDLHQRQFSEHFDLKGREAAQAVVGTLAAHRALAA